MVSHRIQNTLKEYWPVFSLKITHKPALMLAHCIGLQDNVPLYDRKSNIR